MKILTVGVEEEFVLVDRGGRAPVDRGPYVIRAAGRQLGDQVQPEFFNAQVETASKPVSFCADLRDELVGLRYVVREAARAEQCLPVATGTPVLPPERPLTITDGERYERIGQRFASRFSSVDGLLSACHVHVGTLDRDLALALSSRMAPWLPVLEALAVNSPYELRRDTGFASRRAVEHARWPTVGPAPDLDESRYLTHVAELVREGTLLDRHMVFWHSRPSEHVPTLEIRVADSIADVDTVVMLAALVRGLASTLLAELDGQQPGPPAPVRPRLLRAHDLAARHGLAGCGLDPYTGRERPVAELVDLLVERARPALDAAGDTAPVVRQWRHIRAQGTGAARQRASYRRRGLFTDVVDGLAVLTAAG
ncbi:carboxylate-amine ligase [Streptomyces solicathayae]|uniref:Putative glutamate--cysteine ligase 2 n=1 Tax=Streptomyces solicathayae TaxID=3081768 RepID=A0ABZ0LM85_9ACTN|nr:YbdK family carboxylate-amine ligase [Streptomyces sp. HUAS YS2]WOX20405.1 YbdK family carboxylate-amine ligase [Streptomyces sp. HUAS YS2]